MRGVLDNDKRLAFVRVHFSSAFRTCQACVVIAESTADGRNA
jgi:hypothetical protein